MQAEIIMICYMCQSVRPDRLFCSILYPADMDQNFFQQKKKIKPEIYLLKKYYLFKSFLRLLGWHGFTKGKLCVTNLIASHDEMTGLVDEGEQQVLLILTIIRL